ncbi:Retrovirus-related Pol polyprotein from transposon 297,Retrovirus-related Pol polyprotein from transposon 17.6 [Mytilus coruscus]|uniref:Retrovirus-related Pol polyprotein from transposon 297,Retrovirus-related Pol polyprotein from transposon 17.6 n=1 Tax=Mytilus coruscus TaxID=42192 RepID=A0A6J8C3L4_MYTCO|nr:Retrovirus-related Pol polyprotein from transposon 297,Retrovirus-related Pol polyprotein from transposon 17.6 [Mytilus coruscus]
MFKQALTQYPILHYPDFNLPFLLMTDACDTGLGIVLAQQGPEGERAIAYASRTLKPNERNYAVIEKEALAVVWGVKYFRHYLYGRKVTIITDHNPLKWLMNIKDQAGRLARWSLTLQEYDLQIEHRASRKHQNADALSRIPPIAPLKDNKIEDIIPKLSIDRLCEMQRKDSNLFAIINYLEKGELPDQSSKARETVILSDNYELDNSGILYHLFTPGSRKRRQCLRRQLAIPRCLIDEILYACHDDATAGHLSLNKMYTKIQDRFYWKGMYSDVEFWCKSCVDCATKKTPKHRPKAPLNPLPAVSGPFDRVAVDVLGPFPPTYNSNKYILIFSDYLTRWPEAIPVPNADATTTAKVFIEEVVLSSWGAKTATFRQQEKLSIKPC